MSIANELSSDVATAVLTSNASKTHTDAQVLVDILLAFHSALQALTNEARRRRLPAPINTSCAEPAAPIKQAASGN